MGKHKHGSKDKKSKHGKKSKKDKKDKKDKSSRRSKGKHERRVSSDQGSGAARGFQPDVLARSCSPSREPQLHDAVPWHRARRQRTFQTAKIFDPALQESESPQDPWRSREQGAGSRAAAATDPWRQVTNPSDASSTEQHVNMLGCSASRRAASPAPPAQEDEPMGTSTTMLWRQVKPLRDGASTEQNLKLSGLPGRSRAVSPNPPAQEDEQRGTGPTDPDPVQGAADMATRPLTLEEGPRAATQVTLPDSAPTAFARHDRSLAAPHPSREPGSGSTLPAQGDEGIGAPAQPTSEDGSGAEDQDRPRGPGGLSQPGTPGVQPQPAPDAQPQASAPREATRAEATEDRPEPQDRPRSPGGLPLPSAPGAAPQPASPASAPSAPRAQPKASAPRAKPKAGVPSAQPRVGASSGQPKAGAPSAQPKAGAPSAQTKAGAPSARPQAGNPGARPAGPVPKPSPPRSGAPVPRAAPKTAPGPAARAKAKPSAQGRPAGNPVGAQPSAALARARSAQPRPPSPGIKPSHPQHRVLRGNMTLGPWRAPGRPLAPRMTLGPWSSAQQRDRKRGRDSDSPAISVSSSDSSSAGSRTSSHSSSLSSEASSKPSAASSAGRSHRPRHPSRERGGAPAAPLQPRRRPRDSSPKSDTGHRHGRHASGAPARQPPQPAVPAGSGDDSAKFAPIGPPQTRAMSDLVARQLREAIGKLLLGQHNTPLEAWAEWRPNLDVVRQGFRWRTWMHADNQGELKALLQQILRDSEIPEVVVALRGCLVHHGMEQDPTALLRQMDERLHYTLEARNERYTAALAMWRPRHQGAADCIEDFSEQFMGSELPAAKMDSAFSMGHKLKTQLMTHLPPNDDGMASRRALTQAWNTIEGMGHSAPWDRIVECLKDKMGGNSGVPGGFRTTVGAKKAKVTGSAAPAGPVQPDGDPDEATTGAIAASVPATTHPTPRAWAPTIRDPTRPTCSICKKMGHTADACWSAPGANRGRGGRGSWRGNGNRGRGSGAGRGGRGFRRDRGGRGEHAAPAPAPQPHAAPAAPAAAAAGTTPRLGPSQCLDADRPTGLLEPDADDATSWPGGKTERALAGAHIGTPYTLGVWDTPAPPATHPAPRELTSPPRGAGGEGDQGASEELVSPPCPSSQLQHPNPAAAAVMAIGPETPTPRPQGEGEEEGGLSAASPDDQAQAGTPPSMALHIAHGHLPARSDCTGCQLGAPRPGSWPHRREAVSRVGEIVEIDFKEVTLRRGGTKTYVHFCTDAFSSSVLAVAVGTSKDRAHLERAVHSLAWQMRGIPIGTWRGGNEYKVVAPTMALFAGCATDIIPAEAH